MTYDQAVEFANRLYREKIENEARRRWQWAGCPQGKDDEFWHGAVKEVAEVIRWYADGPP